MREIRFRSSYKTLGLNKKEQLLSYSDFNFLSNNVKGLQLSKKRLKLFQCFKNKINPKGMLFLRETHSSKVTEKNME